MLANAAQPLAGPARATVGADIEASAGGRALMPAMLPAVPAAAVAVGGFVAGAAIVGLAHRRRERTLTRARKRRLAVRRHSRARRQGAGNLSVLEIVGSRSLLVDVHLLGGRD